MKTTKAVLLNAVGIVLGAVCGILAYFVAYWLFFDLLPKIPVIPALISWPVDYEWYALTGTLGVDIFVGSALCAFFCRLGGTKNNYGVAILSVLNLIRYINGFVQYIIHIGFSFSLLFAYGLAFLTIVVVCAEFFRNDAD